MCKTLFPSDDNAVYKDETSLPANFDFTGYHKEVDGGI